MLHQQRENGELASTQRSFILAVSKMGWVKLHRPRFDIENRLRAQLRAGSRDRRVIAEFSSRATAREGSVSWRKSNDDTHRPSSVAKFPRQLADDWSHSDKKKHKQKFQSGKQRASINPFESSFPIARTAAIGSTDTRHRALQKLAESFLGSGFRLGGRISGSPSPLSSSPCIYDCTRKIVVANKKKKRKEKKSRDCISIA